MQFMLGVTFGILGFMIGTYVAGGFGLHEKQHVMAVAFSVAILFGLIGSILWNKYLVKFKGKKRAMTLAIFALFASAILLLFRFVGDL